MNGKEWVVLYWSGDQRKEQRFRNEDREKAYRYVMLLPPNAKVYVDHVNFGEEVRVR